LTEREREILGECWRHRGQAWENPYHAEDFRGLEKKGLVAIKGYVNEDSFFFHLTQEGISLGYFIVEGKVMEGTWPVTETGPIRPSHN